MFTKSEIETLDSIVYNELGRKLEDEGYTVRVDNKGQIIVKHKDNLMPRINFSTYTDANDDVSFFAEMKFDATLNYRIVKDGYVRSSDGSTEGIFTFFDIPVNEDIKKECFTEGRFLRYYDNFVEDLKNFVPRSDLRSVEAQIDDFKGDVKKVADLLSKKYGCEINVEFYKTTNK